MKPDSTLTTVTLLAVVLATLHLADDIVHGFEPGGLSNMIGVLIAAVWLYATLALAGRRSGYIVLLVGSFLAAMVPVLHMSGAGVGEIAKTSGGFFFVWTLMALGVTGTFAMMFSARELWRLRRGVLSYALGSVIAVVAFGGALFWFFVYAPDPEVPHLSGLLTEGSIESGGLKRTYLTYVPKGLAKGAPLVVVMHGSGENGRRMRIATGYGFERLADARGFAVVYPNGFEGYWNACNIAGDYAANTRNIDDVAFLSALADRLVQEIGIDPARVFATGISRGGHMAFCLALEAPQRFRAVAAVAANVPVPENFKCKPGGAGTSSVMIMNGTADPLNPFDGGEVQLFGFVGRGKVRSSRASAQYFADLNALTAAPASSESMAGRTRVERVVWRNDLPVEVELVAIQDGGHALPQPYWRAPRILGPTRKAPDGAEVIWDFFARQRPR